MASDLLFNLFQPDPQCLSVLVRRTVQPGPGNFRNLFMYSPNGKKDGIQIIPLSEVAAKDEFLNIKKVSRDDMMAAHRVPPQMMGIMPNNVGGFGDVEKASMVFVRNEIIPLQQRIYEINQWLNDDIISFKEYSM